MRSALAKTKKGIGKNVPSLDAVERNSILLCTESAGQQTDVHALVGAEGSPNHSITTPDGRLTGNMHWSGRKAHRQHVPIGAARSLTMQGGQPEAIAWNVFTKTNITMHVCW